MYWLLGGVALLALALSWTSFASRLTDVREPQKVAIGSKMLTCTCACSSFYDRFIPFHERRACQRCLAFRSSGRTAKAPKNSLKAWLQRNGGETNTGPCIVFGQAGNQKCQSQSSLPRK